MLIGIAIGLIFMLIFLLIWVTSSYHAPEIQMGLVIVIAVGTLLTLLFIVAAGFGRMNLTDATQALALPSGSIRSMIALILILIFIIFGLYLFREVGEG